MQNFIFRAVKSPKQKYGITSVENINSVKYRIALETLKTRILMRIPVMTMNASITSSENSVSDLMVASLVLYKSFVARSGIMFS